MSAFLSFCRHMFKRGGWTLDQEEIQVHRRCVVLAAPHTSNWDAVYTFASFDQIGIPLRFAIKKEWLRWPFKGFMERLGAVPIDRSPKVPGEPRKSAVEAMTELFSQYDDLALLIAPEGTRKLVTTWKTGFYHVAKNAGVPILPAYIDYKERKTGFRKPLYPSDFRKDMRELMEFYQQFHACYPKNFSIDRSYLDD